MDNGVPLYSFMFTFENFGANATTPYKLNQINSMTNIFQSVYYCSLLVDSRTQSDLGKRTKSDRPCCDAHFSRNSIVVHKSRVIQLGVHHWVSFGSNTLYQRSASASFGSLSTNFANFIFINFPEVFSRKPLGERILALSIEFRISLPSISLCLF